MTLSTSTVTLAPGSSRTYTLAPSEAVTVATEPNCYVTVTETPDVISSADLDGQTNMRTSILQYKGEWTYGPYAMGGTVAVAVSSTKSTSSVSVTLGSAAETVINAGYGGTTLAQMSGGAAALSIVASPAGVGSGFNPVYLELIDFAAAGVEAGDQIVATLDWNFPLAATTDRTIQWGIGVNTAGYTSVRSRTPPTTQVRLKMVVTLNIVSQTFARTSTEMWVDAVTPYRVYNDVNTLNLATQKMYVRAYVGDTAHAASDSIILWDANVVKYPRRPA